MKTRWLTHSYSNNFEYFQISYTAKFYNKQNVKNIEENKYSVIVKDSYEDENNQYPYNPSNIIIQQRISG